MRSHKLKKNNIKRTYLSAYLSETYSFFGCVVFLWDGPQMLHPTHQFSQFQLFS